MKFAVGAFKRYTVAHWHNTICYKCNNNLNFMLCC